MALWARDFCNSTLAMKGKPTNRILRLITELSEEGLL